MLNYTDLVKTEANEIQKKRKKINLAAHFSLYFFIGLYILGSFYFIERDTIFGIAILIWAGFILLLAIGLVVKRELYSLAILIKENNRT